MKFLRSISLKFFSWFLLVACAGIIFFDLEVALAGEDERILPAIKNDVILGNEGVSYSEVDRRTQVVLRHFSVATEPSFLDSLLDLNKAQSLSGFNSLLPFFSPDRSILNFLNLNSDHLDAFQDLNSKKRLDFQIQFSPSAQSVPKFQSTADPSMNQHKNASSGETQSNLVQPLSNIRIAIDPGHMGTDFWDVQTGKFVRDSNGRKLSEGLLNLQTALLLKQELEKLGALVLITRQGLHPVSQLAWDKFDLGPVARNELRESIHSGWFLNLVMANTSDQEMLQRFDESAQIKRLFSEASRSDYFIKRVDLWARAEMIEQFKPDIVLVIHYDVAESKGARVLASEFSSFGVVNPKSPRQTKAFVVGGHQADELGSRKNRSFMIRHMLDAKAFANSVRLSKLILTNMQNDLGLELPSSADQESYLVQKGIFARNLVVPRYLTAPAVSYLECLFYDNPSDFAKLSQTENNLVIDGKNYPYSNHLFKIVTAIKNGVLAYSK